jgi:hypothetical protein
MLAAGMEPLEPYPGSTVRWRCRCVTCGSEITPSLTSVRGGPGCIECGHVRTGLKRRMSEASVSLRERGGVSTKRWVSTSGSPGFVISMRSSKS